MTDPVCAPVVVAACDATEVVVVDVALADPGADAVLAGILDRLQATHLVAIERPGRASDGRYWNMKGDDITAWTTAVDGLFLAASARGIVTVGIGDGGNEVGVGRVADRVRELVPHGPRIASIVPTDHLLLAGVSNWGAYGLVAALSVVTGQPLLPTEPEARAALDRAVAAGAVDGVTGRPEPTVDGLPWAASAEVLAALRAAIA